MTMNGTNTCAQTPKNGTATHENSSAGDATLADHDKGIGGAVAVAAHLAQALATQLLCSGTGKTARPARFGPLQDTPAALLTSDPPAGGEISCFKLVELCFPWGGSIDQQCGIQYTSEGERNAGNCRPERCRHHHQRQALDCREPARYRHRWRAGSGSVGIQFIRVRP